MPFKFAKRFFQAGNFQKWRAQPPPKKKNSHSPEKIVGPLQIIEKPLISPTGPKITK